MVLMAHAPVGGDYATDVLPAMVVLGLGAGLSFVSITTAALAGADDSAAGLASGLLSTSVQVGGAVGIAALAAVVSQRASDLVASGSTPIAAQAEGLQLAFAVTAAIALAASIVAGVALRSDRHGADAAARVPALEASP
jgi:hypothetical protein